MADFEEWFNTAILPVDATHPWGSYTQEALEWTWQAATEAAKQQPEADEERFEHWVAVFRDVAQQNSGILSPGEAARAVLRNAENASQAPVGLESVQQEYYKQGWQDAACHYGKQTSEAQEGLPIGDRPLAEQKQITQDMLKMGAKFTPRDSESGEACPDCTLAGCKSYERHLGQRNATSTEKQAERRTGIIQTSEFVYIGDSDANKPSGQPVGMPVNRDLLRAAIYADIDDGITGTIPSATTKNHLADSIMGTIAPFLATRERESGWQTGEALAAIKALHKREGDKFGTNKGLTPHERLIIMGQMIGYQDAIGVLENARRS